MPNNRWLRGLFVLVLLQALLLANALIWPEHIEDFLPWPATPLNARFVAALYCMGVVTSLLSIIATRYAELRISLITLCGLTGGLLVLTLPHLGEFTEGDFPDRWLAFYTADVIVTAFVLWRLRGRDRSPGGWSPAAPLIVAYSTAAGLAGAVMLFAPSFAVDHWPWSLTPILSQVYSIFFLTFATGGALAARDPRTQAMWIWTVANLVTVLIVLGVSTAYPERFKPGAPTWTWYLLWIGGGVALAAALIRAMVADRRQPAVVA
jgi:hypothetical protein